MNRYILILFSVLFISACSETDNSEPPAELVEFESTLDIEKLWSVDTGSGIDQLFVKLFPLIHDN